MKGSGNFKKKKVSLKIRIPDSREYYIHKART
jgi:hypothetical protein